MASVRVVATRDDEQEARDLASRLWMDEQRRVGVARVTEWNRWNHDHPVRTVNRWLVFEESRPENERG